MNRADGEAEKTKAIHETLTLSLTLGAHAHEGFTVLGLCVCYSTSHFTGDYSCHKRVTFSAVDEGQNFKRFSLKMLRCEAGAFPVGTAT